MAALALANPDIAPLPNGYDDVFKNRLMVTYQADIGDSTFKWMRYIIDWGVAINDSKTESYKNITTVLTLLLVIVLIVLLTSWLVIISMTISLQTAFDTGNRLQQQCGYAYSEKETGRWYLYNGYQNYNQGSIMSIKSALTGIRATFFILFFVLFLTMLGSAAPLVKRVAIDRELWQLVPPNNAASLYQTIFVAIGLLLWLGVIGGLCYFFAIGASTALNPLSTGNTLMTQYGLDMVSPDMMNGNRMYILSVVVTLLTFGYVFFKKEGVGAVLPLFYMLIFIVIIGLASVVFKYISSIDSILNGEYATIRAGMLTTLQTNISNNPDLWTYIKRNIKRIDNPPHEPQLQDYMDKLHDYILNANSDADLVIINQHCATASTCTPATTSDADLLTLADHTETVSEYMKALSTVDDKLNNSFAYYVKYVYFITLLIGGFIFYLLMHLLYKTFRSFTVFSILFLLTLIFATVMYIWISGVIYQ